MVLQVFTVFDKKTSLYRVPVYVRNQGQAIRAFESSAMQTGTEISNYPADFELWHLGAWNDETSKYTLLDSPQFIVNAQTLVNAAIRREAVEEKHAE